MFWRRLKMGIPPSWLASKPNETDCSMVLTSGHVIRCVGPNEYDNLRGSGLWFFLGDEWADAPFAAWTETIRPMLSTAKGHALFIGTPKDFNHFRDGYIGGQPDAGAKAGRKSWLFTTAQGGNVDAEEIADALATLGSREYLQEYEASFETFAGRVIYAFSRAESVRECPAERTALPLSCGIDFNILPMTCVTSVCVGGLDYIVDEIILETSNTDELVAEMKRRYGDPSRVTCYPDPAGSQRRTSAARRTDIGILRSAGFHVVDLGSHPKVRDRLNETNARFQAADGTDDPDKSLGFDHLVDAWGYSIWGRHRCKPPAARSMNVMGR